MFMRFCFYGSGLYEALIGRPNGGAELQVALIAQALSIKGHYVTIIDNKGYGSECKYDNIRILFTGKTKRRGLRFFTEKVPCSFWYLYNEKADYYYVRGLSYLYLIPLFISWKLGAKFIVGLSSDVDVMNFKDKMSYTYKTRASFLSWAKSDFVSTLTGIFLLKKANNILVQHVLQKNALSKRKIKSQIFSNVFSPCEIESTNENSNYFVYVGSLCEKKGLDELLEIIALCKGASFKIIGRPQGRYATYKVALLKHYPNVILMGQIPREDVLKKIASSKGLINFSLIEGFPNTFIEAWSVGVPVFSLRVDPGGVLESNNLGLCFSGDLKAMANFLDNYKIKVNHKHLLEYVEENHSYITAANRFIKSINSSS